MKPRPPIYTGAASRGAFCWRRARQAPDLEPSGNKAYGRGRTPVDAGADVNGEDSGGKGECAAEVDCEIGSRFYGSITLSCCGPGAGQGPGAQAPAPAKTPAQARAPTTCRQRQKFRPWQISVVCRARALQAQAFAKRGRLQSADICEARPPARPRRLQNADARKAQAFTRRGLPPNADTRHAQAVAKTKRLPSAVVYKARPPAKRGRPPSPGVRKTRASAKPGPVQNFRPAAPGARRKAHPALKVRRTRRLRRPPIGMH